LWAAYAILKKGRDARAPRAHSSRTPLILDAHGLIERVVTPDRLNAKLVEEFMIQANVAAAEELENRKIPLLSASTSSPPDQRPRRIPPHG
jgi:ribonuclease R